MRSDYKISFLALCILLMSCDDDDWSHGKFEITNKTSGRLDSVYIWPDRKLGRFISLEPNETKKYTTDMGGGGTDGAYMLHYKIDSVVTSKIFGYYANGLSMEKLTKVTILPDTVLFKFIYD